MLVNLCVWGDLTLRDVTAANPPEHATELNVPAKSLQSNAPNLTGIFATWCRGQNGIPALRKWLGLEND
jgi:hypothetical protein